MGPVGPEVLATVCCPSFLFPLLIGKLVVPTKSLDKESYSHSTSDTSRNGSVRVKNPCAGYTRRVVDLYYSYKLLFLKRI